MAPPAPTTRGGNEIEITFADLDVDAELIDQIGSVLRRMRTDGVDDRPWSADDVHVHVAHLLVGGRTDASVLQLNVRRGTERTVRVLKVGPAKEMIREWLAFRQWLRGHSDANVLCAPVEAVTPGAAGVARLLPGELEGLIYNHVAQHSGEPDRDVQTIEDLAKAAHDGQDGALDRVLRVIDILFRRAGQAFYRRQTVAVSRSLRPRNRSLGPDLCVEIDRVDTRGPRHGAPTQDELATVRRLPDQVLRASLAGGRRTSPPIGGTVAINGLRPHEFEDGILRADRDDISVEIRMAPGVTAPARFAKLSGQDSFDLHGAVVTARGARHWDRMRTAFRDARRTETGIVADDVVSGDPFGALDAVLADPELGRVTAVVHGDLNPRNVLVLDDPYLIDYARTGDDQPFLTDFAWLELGLLRDVFADLGHADLVRTQRLLAFGSRLVDLGGTEESVSSACAALSGGNSAAFRMLFAIRSRGRRCYPPQVASLWWRDSLAQLLFAAHRTVKWPPEAQSPAKLSATVAVAAVASEWLTGDDPVRYWDPTMLAAGLSAAIDLLDFDRDESVELVGQLITALDAQVSWDTGKLDELRTRVAHDRFLDVAARIVAERDDTEVPYVDLTGVRTDRSTDECAVLPLVLDESVMLLGDVGSGKSTVAQELNRRLAARITGTTPYAPRLPVALSAADIADRLATPAAPDRTRVGALVVPVADIRGVARGLFASGLVHLIVDDLDDLPPDATVKVAEWLNALHTRFPRTRILVCHRNYGYDPELLPDFTGLVIRDLNPEQVRSYLDGRHLRRPHAEEIWQFLCGESQVDRHAHLRRPLVVEMLANAVMLGHVTSASVGELSDVCYGGLTTHIGADTPVALESLVLRMIDTGEMSVAESELSPVELEWRIHLGMIRQSAGRLWFPRNYRDYVGACALARVGTRDRFDRLGRPHWREPFLLFVSLASTSPATIGELVISVLPTDPGYAAELLRSAWHKPDDAADRFLNAQNNTLRDANAGEPAWQQAAAALSIYGAEEAHQRLLYIAIDPIVAAAAREQALEQLAFDHTGLRLRWLLSTAVRQILADPDSAPDGLRGLALRLVGRAELRHLTLFAAENVDSDRPWPVVRDAMGALDTLGVVSTEALRTRYQIRCHARLLELERLLPGAGARQVRLMQQERIGLLRELASQKWIDLLLRRRFAFQIQDAVRDLVEKLVTDRQVLTDPAAAAHRLLQDAPKQARNLVTDLTEHASADQLQIAAAAVPHLDADGIADAERLFRAVLPVVDADRLVGLAALLQQIFLADRPRGVRLAWLADTALIERDLAARHGWPWHTAVAGARGNLADLDQLMAQDADLAIAGLASFDFHRDARPGPTHVFSSQARARLMDHRQGTVRWVCAAATMGMIEALPGIHELLARSGFGATVEPLTSGRYGRMDNAPLADVLAIAGWLARHAYDTDTPADIDATHRMLQHWPTTDAHHSIRLGRAIGLAYLGDPVPLSEFDQDDRTTAAATNASQLWTPGPHTPAEIRSER